MSEEEEAMEDASGSSEAEISASDPDEGEEEVLEPKVLPQRLTRGGKMNQVRSFPISINPKNISLSEAFQGLISPYEFSHAFGDNVKKRFYLSCSLSA